MKALKHTWYIFLRHFRGLVRQPWYVAFTLVQPVIWLVLYGELFQKVVEIPGFHASSYITFLTPGIVVMTALFSSGWTGMGLIDEMDLGILDRFLVSPISRAGLIAGRLLSIATVTTIQSLLLIGLGYLLGARFPSLLRGVLVLFGCSILLAASFASLSTALALLVRKRESVIAASNFLLLPLTFLSATFMAPNLMPVWIQKFARVNPVNWAIVAGRAALAGAADWGLIVSRIGLLIGFAALCSVLTLRAMRAYQRSM